MIFSPILILAVAATSTDCVSGVCLPAAKVVQQKVIVEPAVAVQTAVQVDQYGGQRVVVTAPAAVVAHGHLSPQAVYATSSHDGSLGQQNAALLQLLAQAQSNQQANQQVMLQLLANQQTFSQQLVAAGISTSAAAVNIQSLQVQSLAHPGEAVFKTRCLSCHAGENPSGGLDLSTLTEESRNASVLAIMSGMMPKNGPLSPIDAKNLGAYLLKSTSTAMATTGAAGEAK